MKRFKFLFINIITLLFVMITLISCGNKSKDKLPTDAYEKVNFAFNGVEKSFKNSSKQSSDCSECFNMPMAANISSALNTIEGIYTKEDSLGDKIDELEYNEPPMIQFQCLKSILTKNGSSFEFGTKHKGVINGEVYLDINTGYEAKNKTDEFKYNYTFILSVEINIDTNDLITADISFNINLTKNSQQYNTVWYVRLELDYDMENTTPNYVLTMLTDNDQGELPYKSDFVYEYDYVEVVDNKIKEWRKFEYETNLHMFKDANHPNFDAYINSGVTYKGSTCKWYKDKNLRKITQSNETKERTIATTLFNDLGLNSTDINSQQFLGKSGKENSSIPSVYSDFSKIFGKDIIYSLVCANEDNEKDEGNQREAASLRFMTSDAQSGFENHHITGSSTRCIRDIFDSTSGAWQVNPPKIYYIDEYGGQIKEESDLTKFNFTILFEDHTATLGLTDPIETFLNTYTDKSGDKKIAITASLASNPNVKGSLPCWYSYQGQSGEGEEYEPVESGIKFVTSDNNGFGLADICYDSTFSDFLTKNRLDEENNTMSYPKLVYVDQRDQIMSPIEYGRNTRFVAYTSSIDGNEIEVPAELDMKMSEIYLSLASIYNTLERPFMIATFTVQVGTFTASFEIRFLYSNETEFYKTVHSVWPVAKFVELGYPSYEMPPVFETNEYIDNRKYGYYVDTTEGGKNLGLNIVFKASESAVNQYVSNMVSRSYIRTKKKEDQYAKYIKFDEESNKIYTFMCIYNADGTRLIFNYCENDTGLSIGIPDTVMEAMFNNKFNFNPMDGMYCSIEEDYKYIIVYNYNDNFTTNFGSMLTNAGFEYYSPSNDYRYVDGNTIYKVSNQEYHQYNPFTGQEADVLSIRFETLNN